MRNMFFIILLLLEGNCFGQNCNIYKSPYRLFQFDSVSNVGKMYREACLDSASYSLFFFAGLSAGNERAILVAVDSGGRLIKSKCLSNGRIENVGLFTVSNELSGFLKRADTAISAGYYQVSCKDVLTWHNKAALVVYNLFNKKWFEFFSLDGSLKQGFMSNGYSLFGEIVGVFDKLDCCATMKKSN